jgi:hypothetical protein
VGSASLTLNVEILGSLLELLVFLQAAHQFGARIVLFLGFGGSRQQHARLDFGQHRRHHQVLGGQFQLELVHQRDVIHILLGNRRDRYIEDVDILALDQVKQQV